MRRRALVDLEALAANLAGSASAVFDARADAYGHDLRIVAPLARELGITALRVSTEREAALARAAGMTEVHLDRLPDTVHAETARSYGLDGAGRPVLTVIGEVIAVKHVGAGAGVSYGYTHRTTAPTTLALVALGYADGVPRLASNRAQVLLEGTRRPVVGRIAMDQFVLDCGGDEPEPGSPAVLFGDPRTGAPSALEWAAWTEREPLTLTSGIAPRVLREAR